MSLDVKICVARYQKRTVLADVAFCAPDGSLVTVIGRNGSGKSTLVSCVASLMPFDGTVTANGVELCAQDVRTRARYLSVLLQELGSPHVTVRELVGFGRNPHRAMLGRESDADREAVTREIADADLSAPENCYVDRISGGEARRAYFGAMLAQNTPVVLLDEATAFMDRDYERKFLGMARALADGGKTVLSVMHDLSAAMAVADRVFSVRRHSADGRLFFA